MDIRELRIEDKVKYLAKIFTISRRSMFKIEIKQMKEQTEL